MPSHQGGVEWGGASFDPLLNVLYVNANEAPSINTLQMFHDMDRNATPVEYGAMIYQKNCTSCHGLERQGNPPTYPALTNLKKTDEQIGTILRQGVGIMPAFAHLSEKDVSAVIAFLKSDGVSARTTEYQRRPHTLFG